MFLQLLNALHCELSFFEMPLLQTSLLIRLQHLSNHRQHQQQLRQTIDLFRASIYPSSHHTLILHVLPNARGI